MTVQAQTSGGIGQEPGPWTRGLALSMIAVALILALVVANQIGGILIAKDLRDEYQRLVNDASGQAAQPASVTQASADDGNGGGVIPELTAKADLQAAPDGESNVAVAPEMPTPADRSEQASWM